MLQGNVINILIKINDTINQPTYWHCIEQRNYLNYIPNKINANTIWSLNNNHYWNHNAQISIQEPYKHTIQ